MERILMLWNRNTPPSSKSRGFTLCGSSQRLTLPVHVATFWLGAPGRGGSIKGTRGRPLNGLPTEKTFAKLQQPTPPPYSRPNVERLKRRNHGTRPRPLLGLTPLHSTHLF